MNYRESAISFECAGETLVGIVAMPADPLGTGVVIAVGGPQYRAGSHRQFTLLARHLAQSGYPTLRFDHRGMGDSSGKPVGFEASSPDIGAAIGALAAATPAIERIVLWGLCDAASAALLYWHSTRDPRVGGLCLLNPWVRSEATLARAQIQHYYRQRFFSRQFWKKLFTGEVAIGSSLAEVAGKVRLGLPRAGSGLRRNDAGSVGERGFQRRMAEACREFSGPVLILLSGNDLTAQEFRDHASTDSSWRGILQRTNITVAAIAGADHTFSTATWRAQVATICEHWLNR